MGTAGLLLLALNRVLPADQPALRRRAFMCGLSTTYLGLAATWSALGWISMVGLAWWAVTYRERAALMLVPLGVVPPLVYVLVSSDAGVAPALVACGVIEVALGVALQVALVVLDRRGFWIRCPHSEAPPPAEEDQPTPPKWRLELVPGGYVMLGVGLVALSVGSWHALTVAALVCGCCPVKLAHGANSHSSCTARLLLARARPLQPPDRRVPGRCVLVRAHRAATAAAEHSPWR